MVDSRSNSLSSAKEACRVLLATQPRTFRRVAPVLESYGLVVLDFAALEQQSGYCEIVVTDQPHLSGLPKALERLLGHGLVGLIRLGGTGVADVVLPDDWTPRELVLACRLLDQTIRLRRQYLQERRRQRRLKALVYRDPLTGLPNRRFWEREVRQLLRAPTPCSVLVAILDVDRFKGINDQHGLAVGDAVLAAIGSALSSSVRAEDLVARLGGDEFALCFTHIADPAAGKRLIERVRQAAQAAATEATGKPVTISGGWVMGSSPQFMSLFAAADQALRQAKQQGRDRLFP
ncbi:MAG: hypothetical protein KatS3mg110_1085 [Pirellulaceae bacterium]|nr:MAG: hypothetical protein KatS3mg110_1085 [Pirellulaceae bacterium]